MKEVLNEIFFLGFFLKKKKKKKKEKGGGGEGISVHVIE